MAARRSAPSAPAGEEGNGYGASGAAALGVRLLSSLAESTPAEAPAGVHVWRLDLAPLDGRLESLLPLLPAGEQARCLRYRKTPDRLRFAASRAALRRLLAERLRLPARAIEILPDARGKPVLACGPALHFNLSHAGRFALIALSTDRPVGVDVEMVGTIDALAMQACLSEAERGYCREHAGARDFFRIWSGKEAVLKAVGLGLATHLPAVSVVPVPSARYAVSLPQPLPSCEAWELEAPPGFVAALALSDPIPAVLGQQAEMAAEGR